MIHSNDNGTEGIMYARTKMSHKACREYLEVMQGRYAAAGHRERTALLDEMETMTGLGRKTLIRMSTTCPGPSPRAPIPRVAASP